MLSKFISALKKKEPEKRRHVISQSLVNVGAQESGIFRKRDFLKKYLGDEGTIQLKMNSSHAGHSQDVDHRAKEEEAENRQEVLACRIETLNYTLTL